MKIGVIGLGVVGQAVFNVLSEHHETIGYDIKTGGDFDRFKECDVVFLCLPTPTSGGYQDISSLAGVITQLEMLKFTGVAVIKSTVLPGTTNNLQRQVCYRLVHNPEFLSAATAEKDFRDQKTILLGASKTHPSSGFNPTALSIVEDVYCKAFPDASVKWGSAEETEMAKYISNVFFAVKVGVFNEFYNTCEKLGINYDASMMLALEATTWIGGMHTNVPGPDGKFGWGGMCFPKDVIAFLTVMAKENAIVKAALEENCLVRPEVKDLL